MCLNRWALPNTRVQRIRSSASAPHSPLTRSPLGGLGPPVPFLAGSLYPSAEGCFRPS
jgi:hypothetical protein